MSLYGEERFFDFDNSGDLDCFERGLMEHEEHMEMERIFRGRSSFEKDELDDDLLFGDEEEDDDEYGEEDDEDEEYEDAEEDFEDSCDLLDE